MNERLHQFAREVAGSSPAKALICRTSSVESERPRNSKTAQQHDDQRYVAIHKEFTRDHVVVSTFAFQSWEGDTLEECQQWCDKANANGCNYKPYPFEVWSEMSKSHD